MLAGLQGAIILIAAKRQDAIAAALAQHDFETNRAAKVEIEELMAVNRLQLVTVATVALGGLAETAAGLRGVITHRGSMVSQEWSYDMGKYELYRDTGKQVSVPAEGGQR